MALAALAVAACDSLLLPLPDSGPPDQMRFSFGGYEAASASVEVRGDTVVLRRRSFGGTLTDSARAVPSAAAWRAFWDEAERAGVNRWARRYTNENVVDGVGWGLRIQSDGWVIESDGSNAYPDRRGREHGEMTADFTAFVDALGDLVGQPLIQ